jgi:uncharacterized protein (DUF58 family)
MASASPPTDPAGLALVARMELVARSAVEGLLSGLHPSPYFGSSVEYADHRPYTPSDELRMLDWKLLAKTDKHYVKLYEEETNTRVTVILDASRSMAFGSDGGMSKLDYGRFLAAAVCHLAIRQNDGAGLATFDRSVRSYLPPRSAGRHFRHVLADLARVTPGADTAVGPVLKELAGRIPKRGIVVLVSDLLDEPESIASGLSLLKSMRHDLVVFHLVDPAERHPVRDEFRERQPLGVAGEKGDRLDEMPGRVVVHAVDRHVPPHDLLRDRMTAGTCCDRSRRDGGRVDA